MDVVSSAVPSEGSAILAALPVEDVPVILFRGQRVITTEVLAAVYGTEVINIQVNHTRNRDRFLEEKHFFKVEGQDLRSLKDRLTDGKSVAPNARSVILWTARGAARHAKILDTDAAWDVFEKLEERYFEGEVTPSSFVAVGVRLHAEFDPFFQIGRLIGLDINQAALAAARAVRTITGQDPLATMGITHLLAPQQADHLTPTDIGTRLGGLSAVEVNGLLHEQGFQTSWRDDKKRLHWEPTEQGKPFAIWLDTGKKHGDGSPVRQLRWSADLLAVLKLDQPVH